MSKKQFRRIVGFLMAAMLIVGTVMIAASTAAAQRFGRRVVIVRPFRPYDPFRFNRLDYYRYRQYVFDNGDAAHRNGYDEGLKTGRSDGKKDKSYDPERSHYFQEAGFGNFAEAYRSGFSDGYRDGYGRVG